MQTSNSAWKDSWWRGLPCLGVVMLIISVSALLDSDVGPEWLTFNGDVLPEAPALFITILAVAVSLSFAIPTVWGWPPAGQLVRRTVLGSAVVTLIATAYFLLLFQEIAGFASDPVRIVGGFLLLCVMMFQLVGVVGLLGVSVLVAGRAACDKLAARQLS